MGRGARSFVLYVFATEHPLFSAHRESVYDDRPSLPLDIRRGSGNHARMGFRTISDRGAIGTWLFARAGGPVQLVIDNGCYWPHHQRCISDVATSDGWCNLAASSYRTWPHSLGALRATRTCRAPSGPRMSRDLFPSPGPPRHRSRPVFLSLRIAA